VIAVAFQSTFHLEMYQDNIFFIFYKLFLKLKHQNDLKTQKNINLKKKKLNFFLKTKINSYKIRYVKVTVKIKSYTCYFFIFLKKLI